LQVFNELTVMRKMSKENNIVKLREVHENEDQILLVMDLYQGGTLRDYLNSMDNDLGDLDIRDLT
jgi:serine/threonine protein kinase